MAKPRKEFSFTGTLISGPDVDLIELAGLVLTDEERDRIWSETSPRRLLVEDVLCEEIETEEIDGGPGNSDSLYEYRCGAKASFLRRLRAALLKRARG